MLIRTALDVYYVQHIYTDQFFSVVAYVNRQHTECFLYIVSAPLVRHLLVHVDLYRWMGNNDNFEILIF